MTLPVPKIQNYGISADRGFLPPRNPIQHLSHPAYHEWESTAKELAVLINNGKIRNAIEEMKVVSIEHLKTLSEKQRAYSILGFLLHGYIWGGKEPATTVPPSVSAPLLAVCEQLELPPVATYAGLVLWNFKSGQTEASIEHPDNISAINTFTESSDECWFFVISVAIEKHAAPMIPLMLSTIQAAREKNSTKVIADLQVFTEELDQLGVLLERMYEGCSADVFYNQLRPFFAGSMDVKRPGLPNGVLLDDGQHEFLHVQYRGGSNGQSSLIQFFDIVLGVEHDSSTSNRDPRGFFSEMRDYMPGPHRRFLADVEQVANIKSYVESQWYDVTLLKAFNDCIAALRNFRSRHIKMAAHYIIIQSQQANSNQRLPSSGQLHKTSITTEERNRARIEIPKIGTSSALMEDPGRRGTGGSLLIPFLRQARSDTSDAAVSDGRHREDGLMQSKF